MSQNNEKDELWALRHSAEHVLMQAMQKFYPKIKMAMGPATDEGFYFDFDLEDKISENDFPKIEKEMQKIINADIPITHEEMSVDEAKTIFKDNAYKLEWIKEIEERGEKVSIYKTGNNFIDVCAGSHVESTGKIGAFKLTKLAGAYWRGDEKNKMLTRIYGTAFPTKNELEEYLKRLEEAIARDHNKLGKELDLFITSEIVGQGLPLLTPKGTKIKQLLQRWVEDEEEKRGYQLTITPFMAKSDLYKISGHWDHYKDGMFLVDGSGEEMALRPMTCPFQFQIFNSQTRSYRDLPIRYNETSTLFRNESSGEMHGLIRLRQFTLSEGHLICRIDQLEKEFDDVLDLINHIMKTLGLTDFWYRFSKWDPNDKKDKYINDPKAWEESQKILKQILNKHKLDYEEVDGDAAFYGPKLDIQMKNVHGKEDTIITVQIDFALPERFDMKYVDKDGSEKRPIIIHRSSIGCYERTLALLIEHYAGAFPLWLSPTQIVIVSVGEQHKEHCKKLANEFKEQNLRIEVWSEDETVGNKIRKAVNQKIPYMLVIGDKEINSEKLHVRKRNQQDVVEMDKKEFFDTVNKLVKDKSQEL
ncbi:MAG: threonine--tRNA ligase [Patescibacteria group bacterium]